MKAIFCAILIATIPSISVAGQAVCPGLTGQARTNCHQAEVQRGNDRTKQINRDNVRLDNAIKVTCAARGGADVTAATTGIIGGSTGRAAAGAWAGGRTIGHVATGGRDKCPGD
jgi:hypothetical protein